MLRYKLKSEKLTFEFRCTQGYFDRIVGPSYNLEEDGKIMKYILSKLRIIKYQTTKPKLH